MTRLSYFTAILLSLLFSCKKPVQPPAPVPSGPIQVDASVPEKVWLNVSKQEQVFLDARRTSTLNGKRALTFQWTVKEAPQASGMKLFNADTDLTWFQNPQKPGLYLVELLVREKNNPTNETRASYQMTILEDTLYLNPARADAGPDQVINAPESEVWLDATPSFKINPDGRSLVFNWTQISKPAGAPNATFNNAAYPNQPRVFVSNLAEGVYQFRLELTNELGAKASDTVQVRVLPDPLSGTVMLRENLAWEKVFIEQVWEYQEEAVVVWVNDPLLSSKRVPANTEVRVWNENTQSWTKPNEYGWWMYSEGKMLIYYPPPADIDNYPAYIGQVGKKTKVEIRFL